MTNQPAESAKSNRSLESRIAARLTGDGVIISGRMAQWLEQQVRMTADRRIRLRHNDPEAYENLTALHLAALRSESGTNQAAPQANSPNLDMWMSTSEAADAVGVTDRCIRKWCEDGQLGAIKSGGRWLINRNTLALKDIA